MSQSETPAPKDGQAAAAKDAASPQRKEISCSSCGAPLPYLEGEALLSCDYCGRSVQIAGMGSIVAVEHHSLVPNKFERRALEEKLRAWMAKGFFKASDLDEKARVSGAEVCCLPFWVVSCRAETFWSGMDRRTRSVGKRTETYYVPENGTFTEAHNWKVYARREEQNPRFGLDALNPGASATVPDWGGFWLSMNFGSEGSRSQDFLTFAAPFSIKDLPEGISILNGQITQPQSEAEAREQIERHHRRLAEGKTDRLMNAQTTVKIEKTTLVHVPLWFFGYEYKGKKYRATLNGHSGEVVKGEAPVGEFDKVVVSGAAAVLALGGCGALAYFQPQWRMWAVLGGAAVAAAWTGHLLNAMRKARA